MVSARSCLSCVLVALLSAPAMAVVNSISTTGPGVTLESVTVNRSGLVRTYSLADLIGVDLTAFSGASASVVLLPDGGSVPATGSRATLIEDARLDTGIINPAVSATAMAVNFASPVINSFGEDIILFEFDPANEGNDTLAVRINGVTMNISASALVHGNVPLDVFSRTGGTPTTLAQVESSAFTLTSNNTTQSFWAYSIDLSLFGIAPNASITSMQFGAGSSSQVIDPVFLAGLPPIIPEPATALLLFVGAAGLARRRRAA